MTRQVGVDVSGNDVAPMPGDSAAADIANDLIELLDRGQLTVAEEDLAQQSYRRITQPLRLIVLGTDSRHVVSLLEFLVGMDLPARSFDRLRLQCTFSHEPYASAEYSDGSMRTFVVDRLSDAFAEAPVRLKIGADRSVLKKLSFMAATDSDAIALSGEVEQTLLASDIALFSGGSCTGPLLALLARLPDRLRHHSYLTLAPETPPETWQEAKDDFADVITIDPWAAIRARDAAGGVDKDAFRKTGGAALVKAVRRELDVLKQSALDAAQVLLARHAVEAGHPVFGLGHAPPEAASGRS